MVRVGPAGDSTLDIEEKFACSPSKLTDAFLTDLAPGPTSVKRGSTIRITYFPDPDLQINVRSSHSGGSIADIRVGCSCDVKGCRLDLINPLFKGRVVQFLSKTRSDGEVILDFYTADNWVKVSHLEFPSEWKFFRGKLITEWVYRGRNSLITAIYWQKKPDQGSPVIPPSQPNWGENSITLGFVKPLPRAH